MYILASLTYDLTAKVNVTYHYASTESDVCGARDENGGGQLGYQHDQIYLCPSYPHPYVVTGEGLANTYANPPK